MAGRLRDGGSSDFGPFRLPKAAAAWRAAASSPVSTPSLDGQRPELRADPRGSRPSHAIAAYRSGLPGNRAQARARRRPHAAVGRQARRRLHVGGATRVPHQRRDRALQVYEPRADRIAGSRRRPRRRPYAVPPLAFRNLRDRELARLGVPAAMLAEVRERCAMMPIWTACSPACLPGGVRGALPLSGGRELRGSRAGTAVQAAHERGRRRRD